MKNGLRHWWRQWREEAALRRRAIPDALWRRTLKRFAFLPGHGEEAQQLRRLSSLFLDAKEFSGAQGLRVTDDMAVAVAAQACLPVLHLGLEPYRRFVGIVMHPRAVVAHREVTDEDGIVHAYEETLSGEAVDGGPVMLSWRDVRGAGASAAEGYNVVIHEFAHVLDMAYGLTQDAPALPPHLPHGPWMAALHTAHSLLVEQVSLDQPPYLDPYACEGLEEFFAVSTEAFFVAPDTLQANAPAWYTQLQGFFSQDPAGRRLTRSQTPSQD